MMGEVLETGRMVLRRMEMAEVDHLMGIFSGPVAIRYYPGTKRGSRRAPYTSVYCSRASLSSRQRCSRALISASAPLSFGP